MKFSRIAFLSAATLAVAQPHNHAHRHKRGSPVEARDAAATTVVSGPVVTVYQLNGQAISWDDVQQGIKDGKYVLVGGQVSAVASAAPVATSAPASSAPPASSAAPAPSVSAAQFVEKKPSSSSAPSSTYVAPASSSKAASSSAPSASSSSSSGSGSSSSTTGSWPDYDGSLDCSTFPSKYGAVEVDWTGLNGFTGVQNVPSFGGDFLSGTISSIVTAISGSGCTKNSFCSYACPAGYQKSQWPTTQGSTGQSIGGLYCDSNGKLQLSRPDVKQLCIAGTGGVTVKSSLSKVVSICRTDYPGTESETVPLAVEGGQQYPLTCPDANTYYFWEGKGTSAQYYLNPSGYAPKDACWWNTAGSNLGNYSPANLGVGKGADGITYISLFPNHPSNMNGVLDYNVAITGGSGSCAYKNGQYLKDGVVSATGCTVSQAVSVPIT
jgi:hypothetical protein